MGFYDGWLFPRTALLAILLLALTFVWPVL